MGLTEIQKEMIRGIATNNMLKARQGALGALNEDTTQKNKNFVARYKSILTSEHGFLYELPAELKGLLQCEDVCMSYTHIAVVLNHAYIYVLISHIYLCKRNMDICVNYEHRNKVNISNQKGIRFFF